jgi:hypothetical protein
MKTAPPKRRLDHSYVGYDEDEEWSNYVYYGSEDYYYNGSSYEDDYCSCDEYYADGVHYYSYYDYYYSYYNYYYSYSAAPEGDDKVEEAPEDVSGYWSMTWYTD